MPATERRTSAPAAVWLLLLLAAAAAAAAAATEAAGDAGRPAAPPAGPPSGALSRLRALLAWPDYKRAFHKSYQPGLAETRGLAVFLAKAMRAAHSLVQFASGARPYYLAINKFSDTPDAELRRRLGAPEAPPAAPARSRRSADFLAGLLGRLAPRKQPDGAWQHQCLGAVQDQLDCGCCYAMATLKMFEWLACNQTGSAAEPFSAQYVVDCGPQLQPGLSGCQSGSAEAVLGFVAGYGLLPASLLPYLGQPATCPLPVASQAPRAQAAAAAAAADFRGPPEALRARNLSHKVLGREQWAAELEKRPLLLFLALGDDFFDYGGGVLARKPHKAPEESYAHFVLLVGAGVERGKPYWLALNSFGPDWGLSGLFKISQAPAESPGFALRVEAQLGQPQ